MSKNAQKSKSECKFYNVTHQNEQADQRKTNNMNGKWLIRRVGVACAQPKIQDKLLQETRFLPFWTRNFVRKTQIDFEHQN